MGFGTGRTSEGESLYYTILKSPSALSDFDYVWEHGNAQARAYALTAFWKLDRVRFERDATEFIRENPIVVSQHVDDIGHIDPMCVVRGIRIGVPSYCYSAQGPPPGTQFLGRRLVLFLANQWQLSALDDGTIDRHFGDVFAARDVVHDV